MTKQEALNLIGTERNGGTVIGVESFPGRGYPEGLYLIIVFHNKRAEYESVDNESA